jgi:hypothetical protein
MLMFLLIGVLASMFVFQAKGQQATVSVVPASITVPTVGSTLDVNVTVESVADLYAWALKLYYPNDILNGTSVTEGPFLKTGGFPNTAFLTVNFTDNYNATFGIVDVLDLRTGDVQGANGSGTLVTVTFTSTSRGGPQALHLAGIALSDSNTTAINFTSVDGEVTVIPEYPTALFLPLLIASTLAVYSLRRKK